MQRSIISINYDKCTGCGECIPNCPEGALQIVDGKARLISDLLCDGLGACLGHCPENAITVETREAEPYDERKVIPNIIKQGENTLKAHLDHLKSHNQEQYYNEAVAYLQEHQIPIPQMEEKPGASHVHGSCPGSRSSSFEAKSSTERKGPAPSSQLTHWPVQIDLLSPAAPHYKDSDLLIAADCVAYAVGDFHEGYLKGKTLAVTCPKLTDRQEIHCEKIWSLIDDAHIKSITVMIMQVPCCRGLLNLVQRAAAHAQRKIPLRCITVSLQGDIIQDASFSAV